MEDSLEMAILSHIVYLFRLEPEDNVCPMINARNYTIASSSTTQMEDLSTSFQLQAEDLHCHWYKHDLLQGTQVMMVSSHSMNYLAVVFAGTNDLTTALTDMDVWTTPFGSPNNFTLPDERIAVHTGFNNAIFSNNIFFELDRRIEHFLSNYSTRQDVKLFTTGHSLGAADAILLAAGLTYKYPLHHHSYVPKFLRKKRPRIQSITFGCPRIGNEFWKDFVNNSPLVSHMDVWRLVLGWDLVPRLPELMVHVGHTIQLNSHGWTTNATVDAYYRHLGDTELGYAGVPYGWSSTPFLWVPGALWSHHITKYIEFILNWKEFGKEWVTEFATTSDEPDDDDHPPNVDDDFWVNPPDDPPVEYR